MGSGSSACPSRRLGAEPRLDLWPAAHDYELVYANIGKPEVLSLPFFSQLALVQAQACERATAFDYRVGVAFASQAQASQSLGS
jgi:hypothetical protein